VSDVAHGPLVLKNHGPQGSGGATIEETVFTFAYIGKYFKNLLKNQFARKAEIYLKAFRYSIKASLLK
jgi:hypothetical protein